MSVLGSQTFQSKPLRAVAKKSTSKPPRLWTNGKPPLVMEEDIEQMETSSEVIKTADSTVHQEPCNSLKSLNGAVVADKPSDSSHNGVADASVDKVTTSVLHVTVENTDSSDLLDSKPEKDNNGVIDNTNSTLLDGPTSTDDEDMLLMLSDSDSLTSQDVNDLALNKIVNDSSNNENTNDSALNKDVNALALNKDVKELANDIDVNELALNEDVNQSALNENVNKSALNKNVDELVLITDEIASSSNKDANELEIETEPDKIKDVKAQADHPLAIGVKVRNSVRDIMSKLVQDASPEVNKILSKPKFEEVMKDSPPKSLKPYLDYKSDAKLVKGNLFEIMSAESEPEDMQCSTNPKTQNKIKSGDNETSRDTDSSIPSDSLDPTAQAEQNTQDQPVSPVLLDSEQNENNTDSPKPEMDKSDQCLINDNISPSSTNIPGSAPITSPKTDVDVRDVCSPNLKNTPETYSEINTNSYPASPKGSSTTQYREASVSAHDTNSCESLTSVSCDCNSGNLASSLDSMEESVATPLSCENIQSQINKSNDLVTSKMFDDSPADSLGGIKEVSLSNFDSDDNSNNSGFSKIDIDKICDSLLNDDSKHGVSEEKDKAATKDVLMETGDENKLKIENKGDIKKVKSQDDNFTMKNEEMDSKEFTKLDTKVEYKPIINTEMKLKIKEEIKTYLKSESAEVKDIKSDVLNSKCVIEDSSSVSNKKINVIEKSDTKDAKLETVTVACAEKMDIDEENNYNSNIESKSNTLDNIKEKKRSIDPSESEGPAPAKRSRLDIMIGKLGDQIGIAPENVPDTISCESDSEEESRQESDDVSEIKSDDEDVRSDDNTADETASKVTEEDADTRSMQEEVHAEADVEKTDIKVAEKSETKTTGTEADIETTEKKMDSKKENETEPTKEVIDLKITEESSIITLDKTESKASDTESVLSTSVDDIEMISDPVKDDNDVTVIISESPEKHQTEIVQEATTSNEKETDLEKMVRKKVLQLIKSYRDETIADLQRKITTLTEANEKWKNTAKDLHKQVVDLTIVQHRLDKRKAATAALKIITSRTIGCQVDSNRLPPLNGYEVLSAQKSPPKTTILSPNQQYTFTNVQMLPGSTPNMVSMIKRPAPVQVNNMSQLLSATAVSRNSVSSTNTILSSSIRQAVPVNTSMRNLLETSGKNAKAITTSQINNVLSGVSRSVVTPNSTVGNSVKVIDLTADEDTAKKINKPPQGKPHVTMMPVASLPPSMGSPQIVRPIGTASSGLPPGASILLSSGPAGTQFVNPSTLRGIGGNLQVVTVSGNNSSIRAGSLLTVVPSQSTTATYPQTVSITTAAPTSTLTTKTVTLDTSNIMMRTPVQTVHTGPPPTVKSMILNTPKHPAPLPPQPVNKTSMGGVKGLVPPKPDLKISRVSQGIVLSWTITHKLTLYSEIASYQLFAYQEGSSPPNSNLWKKVGDVKALPLPMACTLTQFQEGNKYHFAVRALDVYNRISEFSEPSSIHLFPKSS
ncbi:activating transcription factor 7-interacting protein 1 isoform X1 [Patella vulgata]|uniref:activating transcription factor 7-interacting protein 1 isoform X1 n=1 Tax=Patella vulgata TaxID=6465 RepID=UPI00217F9B82|nr:activating transcription factor 7-interacting protein 1 isoform X1 [Patella vulgata]